MKLRELLRSFGSLEMLTYAPEYLAELCRHRFDRFDSIHGTETNTSVPTARLDGTGFNQVHAELYWPIRPLPFDNMMRAIGGDLHEFAFIDLGCGKGRALLLAADWPFKRLIGVEFSQKLCDVAERNLEIFRAAGHLHGRHAEVHCIDASAFRYPPEPLVVFLFDPFGPSVLKLVIDQLKASLAASPRACLVAYHLPMHADLFLSASFKTVAHQRRSIRLAYPWMILQAPQARC